MFDLFASGHHPGGQSTGDLSDIPIRLADMLFNEASLLEIVLVAMLVALAFFIHKSDEAAKKERSLNQEKFENLIIRSQDTTLAMATDLTQINTRLDNIEREIETQKDFLFTQLRKT